MRALQLDCIYWLVAPQNPLKAHKPAALASRLAAARAHVRAARETRIHCLADNHFYTIDTVRAWSARYPATHFVWLMGADNWRDFHHWQDWRAIAQTMPIAIYPRRHATLPSMAGLAAHYFARARHPTHYAPLLAQTPAPAWLLLAGRESGLASSDLRR